MDNLSSDSISRLRELFGLMVNSRRHLRPILADIAASIDKGIFIDADSEEVNRLLRQILGIQEQFAAVEQLKKATASKKIEQVEKNLAVLEQNCQRNELNKTLAKIETLVVDSEEPEILDAVKKVKLQAEHLRNKSGKLDADTFAKSAARFVLLTEIIDSTETFSAKDFKKISDNFQDNLLIAMALTSNLIHFPKPIEIAPLEEDDAEVSENEDGTQIIPNRHRIKAVISKCNKVNPDMSLVNFEDGTLEIEKAKVKKQLTVKSFSNKLHELLNSVDPMPIFKILIKTRIFFKDDPKEILVSGKLTKKLAAFVPVIIDKLFSWGVVDKIIWRTHEFYFLNDSGLALCIRALTHKPLNSNVGEHFKDVRSALQVGIMIIAEPRIKNGLKFNFAYNQSTPAARAEIITKENSRHVILMFSLILLGEDWAYDIARFKILIEREIEDDADLRAVFIFGFYEKDISWLNIFDTTKFKKIKFFMCTWEGLFDQKGKPVEFEDWMKICKFGVTGDKPAKISEPPKKSEKLNNKKSVENIRKSLAESLSKLDLFNAPPKIEPDKKIDEDVIDVTETAEISAAEENPNNDINFFYEQENISDVQSESEVNPAAVDEPEEIIPVDEEKDEPEEIIETDAEKTTASDLVKADSLMSVTNLFKAGAIGRGMLALHALKDYLAENDPDAEDHAKLFVEEVGFVLDDPMTTRTLHNFDTFTFWTSGAEIPKANIGNSFEWLNLAAMIKNFYAPIDPTSYQIQKSWKQLNEDKSNFALKSCPAAKTLISLFNNFTEKTHRAFSDCLTGAGNNSEQNFQAAVAQVKTAENVADSVLHSDVNHRRVKDLIQQIFNNNGLVRKFLSVDNYKSSELIDFCRQFEKTNLNEIIFESNPTIDAELFSEQKIGDFLDSVWDKPNVRLVRREHEPFIGPKRKKVTNVMKQILVALVNYVYAKKILEESGKSDKQPAPTDKALEILADLKKQLTKTEKKSNLGQVIFRLFIENLVRKINGENVALSYSECLLSSNYIELENDMPVVESFGIADFSLKNRVANFESDIKYKKPEENLQNAYDAALKNYDCGILQSLAKHFLPQLKISEEDINKKLSGLERQVDRQIERVYNDFLSELELARNYSRITDQEKIDFYINAVVDAKQHFIQTRNAGLFRRFVNACSTSIEKVSLPQKNALTKRLEKLEENLATNLEEGEVLENRYPVLARVRQQIDLMNLTVAEDYMNRLESEGDSLLTELDVNDSNLGTLEEFLAEYETLLRTILNTNGSIEAAFKQRLHTNRYNRETQNAVDFLHGWQGIHSGQNAAIENSIIEILNHLGYSGGKISAQNLNTPNQKSYTVTFSEPVKVRDSYAHPFSVFGTEVFTKGLEIIYLGTNRKYENVTQVLSEMTVERGTICLMDHSLTLPERRSLAKVMKTTPNLKNILVIDKVMALYLARFDDANRGKRMLQTALPFARVQPYTTGSVVAPEMFIGRSEELDQIRDMAGPVFVYGGRQLGKSALLRQVRSIEHDPRRLNYAFFIDLKNLNSEQTLKKIVYELRTAKLISQEIETWSDFSMEIHKLLNGQLSGINAPQKLLLLLDESDTFLSEKDSEKAIDILRELRDSFSGKFKFVLAGLHKVIRFEQNSGFGNLNHISVLPFRPIDAMELLGKPMSYLGFRIADDGLISAIFSRTNYYPGSIQYYCKMLVDAVGSNYTKQNFDVVKNPPYTLDDEYLKNVLGNREFQEEIDQKFQITLHLDDDNFYEILALAVAMIYYEHNRPVSVEVTDIRNVCLMCGVEKITRLSDIELMSLLDEMVALNILRRTDGKFEFNRYAFWHMMGTETEVNDKLDSYGTLVARD